MNRVILDHFRRWWWVMALGALYAAHMGWSLAQPVAYLESWRQNAGPMLFPFVEINLLARMIPSNTYFLATFTGAMLLMFDLQRGCVRVLKCLPVTNRQIGQGWWLATAGIPAVASVTLIFLGAGTFCIFHADTPFPMNLLVLEGVLIVLWYGTLFTTFYTKPTIAGWRVNWRTALFNLGLTAALIWMLFGFALSTSAYKSPVKCGLLFLLGVLMTIVGWSRAVKFNPEAMRQTALARAGSFMPRRAGSTLTPLSSEETRDLLPVSHGSGAIAFLMRTMLARILIMVAIVVVYAGFWFWIEGIVKSWDDAIRYLGGMAVVFWVLIFFQITPVLRHLRVLRSMPISSGRLAVVLTAMGFIPLLALGVVIAGAAWLISGGSAAIAVLGSYTFTLAPAALCVCFAVWRGAGLLSSVFLLFVMIGAFMLSYRGLPIPVYSLIVVVCVAAGFLLTRRALNRSRHAYLSQSAVAKPFDGAWAGGA